MFEQMDEILVLTDARFIKQKEYWIKKLSGDIAETAMLPRYKKSDRSQRGRKARKGIEISIPNRLTGQLIKFSKKADLSLYLILLAALKSLIYRYTEDEDIIVVSPVLETHVSAQTLNDRLLIRDHVNGYMTFKELLIATRQSTLEAYENQDYPFEKIMKFLDSTQIHSGDSFSDILCLLANIHDVGIIERVKSGLVFSFIREEEQLKGSILYDSTVYEKNSIQQVSQHFLKILEVSLVDINKKISEISFLSEQEVMMLIESLNHTGSEFPGDKTLHQLFEEQVDRTPDNTALVHGHQELSYRELNKKANQLAGLLREKGVNPGCIVGIMSEPSIEMMVGILGILKGGGAYLPVDPGYPGARIAYILDDSQVKTLLTQNHLSMKMNFYGEVIQLTPKGMYSGEVSNLHLVAGRWGELAYIIYTSGSTGNPKGVMIEHAPVINLVYAQKERFKINETDRILQFSSICFDASVEQIFISFLSGSVLVLADKNTFLDKDKFERFILNYSLTHIHAVPSFLKNIELKGDYNLKRMIAGGDVCPPSLARKWYKNCDFYNEYGPTETTVTSIEFQVKILDERQPQLPIGKPLNNTRVYFLDRWMRFVPLGAPGEMYIGGVGVARGYQNNPELTMDKFLSNPFAEGDRLYRTGDRGRWLPDGNIQFLGRIDQQVKLRGFRIELGEIENQLINYRGNVNLAKAFNKQTSTVKPGRGITHCTRCLLSSNYPGIHFDKEGICNICREYEEYEPHAKKYFSDIHDFYKIIEKAKKTGHGDYDCMLLFSGGKDSSYVLYRLVDMGLKVLAFTFDNGYISDIAFENIRRVTSKLNVDSIICQTDHMKEIFVESLNQDHTVCSGCFKALTTISTRIALERKINVIVTGLSRGQIFDTKLYGLFKQCIFDVKEIEERLLLFRKMYHSTNDRISELLNVNFDEKIFHQVYFMDFFRYDGTTVNQIKMYLRGKDIYWSQPGDTGFCSTNCIINDVGIYVHLKDTGYHNYEGPLSWDCRLGQGNRQEMLKEVESPMDIPRVEKILHEIGYGEKQINAAVVLDREDETGEKYLCAYLVSQREIDIPHLKKYLSARLPDYMVPAYFVRLAKLPVTSNGKVDRKAMPGPEVNPEHTYVAPGSAVEKKLVEIWAEVLSIPKNKISIDANFFELGGHSLNAMQLVSRIHKEFDAKISLETIFKIQHIRGLAEVIKETKEEIFTPIELIEKKDHYPLSFNQKRLWIIQQRDYDSSAYNINQRMRFNHEINIEALKKTLYKIVAHYESLRTRFEEINGKPRQIIEKEINIPLKMIDISRLGDKQKQENREEIYREIANTPIRLNLMPLFNCVLVKLENELYDFIFVMHHIISDGVSLIILRRDFSLLYEAYGTGREIELPPLELQYKDFSGWQNKQINHPGHREKSHRYWKKKFEDGLPVLELPVDFYTNRKDREGAGLACVVSKDIKERLGKLARSNSTTFSMVMFAAFNILLSYLTGQKDIVCALIEAGRHHLSLHNILGFFINSVFIKSQVDGEMDFNRFLDEIGQNVMEAFQYQAYPLELVLDDWGKEYPDISVSFNMLNIFEGLEQMELDDYEPYHISWAGEAKFDLEAYITEYKNGIEIYWSYRKALFKPGTIENIFNTYVQVLDEISEVEGGQ